MIISVLFMNRTHTHTHLQLHTYTRYSVWRYCKRLLKHFLAFIFFPYYIYWWTSIEICLGAIYRCFILIARNEMIEYAIQPMKINSYHTQTQFIRYNYSGRVLSLIEWDLSFKSAACGNHLITYSRIKVTVFTFSLSLI